MRQVSAIRTGGFCQCQKLGMGATGVRLRSPVFLALQLVDLKPQAAQCCRLWHPTFNCDTPLCQISIVAPGCQRSGPQCVLCVTAILLVDRCLDRIEVSRRRTSSQTRTLLRSTERTRIIEPRWGAEKVCDGHGEAGDVRVACHDLGFFEHLSRATAEKLVDMARDGIDDPDTGNTPLEIAFNSCGHRFAAVVGGSDFDCQNGSRLCEDFVCFREPVSCFKTKARDGRTANGGKIMAHDKREFEAGVGVGRLLQNVGECLGQIADDIAMSIVGRLKARKSAVDQFDPAVPIQQSLLELFQVHRRFVVQFAHRSVPGRVGFCL